MTCPSTRPPAAAGFTLIELLVAMTLFALLMAAMFGGLRLATRIWESAETRLDAATRLQITEAKSVCRRCPVVSECLTWALESGQVQALRGIQLRGLSTLQVSSLTTDQWQLLGATQIDALSTTHIAALTPDQAGAITTDQLQSLLPRSNSDSRDQTRDLTR